MKERLTRLRDYFLPPHAFEDEDRLHRYRLFVSVSFLTALYSAIFLPISIWMNYQVAILPIYISMSLDLIFPVLLKNRVRLIYLANLYLLNIAVEMTIFFVNTGGLSRNPENPVFLVVLPIIALLCLNRRASFIWLGISLLILATIGIAEIAGVRFPMAMNSKYIPVFVTFSFCGLVALLFIFILIFDEAKNEVLSILEVQNKLLEEEKQKSDDLLLNILPAEISKELKETGKTKAHSYEVATVMFADFVDFTKIGERLSPEDLVFAIGNYFETFDQIVERNGIEKIKTVGDAYICAAGLPIPSTDNALIMIRVALEFLSALVELNDRRQILGDEVFNIRIGVNTGPLVAGVVGIKKFAYDIWGDTVNTAARLQENGLANRINISKTTYELIKHRFQCTYRGKIEAKNKGEIDMYFVEGNRVPLASGKLGS